MKELTAPILDEIKAARGRMSGTAMRTPLVRWNGEEIEGMEIYLKLENLQPIGSFKLRGSGNAMLHAAPEDLANGVWTASAGNMAQGVAWMALRLGVPCSVVVPDHAPEIKLAALRRLNATILKIPFPDWWQILMTHQFEGSHGFFIHPVCNRDVIAGNGVIGLEILEDLPDVDRILVPYGGGGLSCGIASAAKALEPDIRVYACEPVTAAPLAASLAAGKPVEIQYTPSFIDGAGGRCVLPEMWPLASALLDGSRTVTVEQCSEAIRLLVERHHVVAEGAGALPLAAALQFHRGGAEARSSEKKEKVVCVISGGNLDPKRLVEILAGS